MGMHTQQRLHTIMLQQTEAAWRGKCRWWDERPRWDLDQLRANKLLTEVVQEAQGPAPVLGEPQQKNKVFDINNIRVNYNLQSTSLRSAPQRLILMKSLS